MLRLACIVEGHGERESVRTLVQRIVAEQSPGAYIHVEQPLRIPKSRLLKIGELERAVELAARRAGANGAIFILLDSDDDCPAELGPQLLRRARAARGDVPIAVTVAKREFEAWFLAAAESLRGRRGLPVDLQAPPNPEEIRGAKEWLADRMTSGSYSETLDQPALTDSFDLNAARRADSFDKCWREVSRLLAACANADR